MVAFSGREKHDPTPKILITTANGATPQDVHRFLAQCFDLGIHEIEIKITRLTLNELSKEHKKRFGEETSNK